MNATNSRCVARANSRARRVDLRGAAAVAVRATRRERGPRAPALLTNPPFHLRLPHGGGAEGRQMFGADFVTCSHRGVDLIEMRAFRLPVKN